MKVITKNNFQLCKLFLSYKQRLAFKVDEIMECNYVHCCCILHWTFRVII